MVTWWTNNTSTTPWFVCWTSTSRNSLPKAQRRKSKRWKGKLMQMSERYNKHFVSLGLLFHVCHNCKKHPGEKEARRRLKACQKKGTIKRPKGTAGRHFSLQEAMNLDGKDTLFKRIRVSILSLPLYTSSQFFPRVQNHWDCQGQWPSTWYHHSISAPNDARYHHYISTCPFYILHAYMRWY